MYLPYTNLRTKQHEIKKYLPNIHQKHIPTTNFPNKTPNSLFLVYNHKKKKKKL